MDEQEGHTDAISMTPASDTTFDPVELLATMGRDFADSRDIDKTLRLALVRITDYLRAESGALFLLDDSSKTLTCTACTGATDIEGLVLASNQGIVGRCVQTNRGELVRDVELDADFFRGVDRRTGFTTRSIICAPMSVRAERIGAIELVNKKGKDFRFSTSDLRLLETMSSSAALAILNAHLAEALLEQERVRRELELAAEIQRSLLPEAQDETFPIHGINIPAGAISGDFYDYFTLPDGRIYFNLGDVSGKGMNAALLMAKTSSIFRCLGKATPRPGRLLARINTEIHETATRGMFVTMVGGIYDPASGEVVLANAGHQPPVLQGEDGQFTSFEAETPPLGIQPFTRADGDIPEVKLNLDGGTLYVFSDGITEGYRPDGTMLHVEGLLDMLRDSADLPAAKRLTAVTDLLAGGGRPLRDDVTLLAIDDRLNANARSNTARSNTSRLKAEAKPDAPTTEAQNADTADYSLLAVLTVPARADRLRLIRHAVSMATIDCGLSETAAGDLILAVDEACQNIIRHAYGGDTSEKIVATVSREGDNIVVLLRDFAPTVDTERIRPRDLSNLRPGGLGTHFIRECLDDVRFLPSPPGGGNLLRLEKKIR